MAAPDYSTRTVTSKCASSRRVNLPSTDAICVTLDRRFRTGHAAIIAALTRRFGVEHFTLIENAVQDAYLRALDRWPNDGEPADVDGWLVRVAHNALIDALRRDRATEALDVNRGSSDDPPPLDGDDELRLVFLCCDPVLNRASQIALVLSVAFGLTAAQIANAFLSDERTVAQRLVRAKQQLRERGVHFEMPAPERLPERVAAILDVLYIVFSEGYNPTRDDSAIDAGLCNESLRLTRLLASKKSTASPAVLALQALLCFHSSRARAKFADDGSLLLLPEQDRSKWDRVLINEAFACLEHAAAGSELTRFHVEAGIAACHATATTFAVTDWPHIVELYDLLRQLAPSLVVDVNRAFAIAMLSGARAGLDELDAIPERDVVARYPYALATYADLHASLGNLAEARGYLDRALEHQQSPAQRALLERKRAALERA